MTIEATSQIDYETYRRFYLFTFLHGRKPAWQAPLMLALAPALTIAFLVMYLLDTADVLNLIGFVLMLGVSLVMAAIVTILPQRYYLSVEKQLMTPNHYRFMEDRLELRTGDADSPAVEYPYEKIEKAHDTGDGFYISLGPGQICIIGQDDFTAGTPDDLRRLLNAQLGDRVVDKRKK